MNQLVGVVVVEKLWISFCRSEQGPPSVCLTLIPRWGGAGPALAVDSA